MKLALAAFDMDGTILEEDSSWVALHRHFGTTRTGKRGLKLYTDGKIDYTEFMRRDIASWPKNLAIDEVDRILSKYRIRKEAPETVNRLKDLGAKVTLVTSGIDILAERVARDLGIDSWVANGLETTPSGRLAGTGISRVDRLPWVVEEARHSARKHNRGRGHDIRPPILEVSEDGLLSNREGKGARRLTHSNRPADGYIPPPRRKAVTSAGSQEAVSKNGSLVTTASPNLSEEVRRVSIDGEADRRISLAS